MNRTLLMTRRSLIAGAAATPLALALRPAFAAGDVSCAPARIHPVNVAVTPFVGDEAKIAARHDQRFAHSIFLSPINPTSSRGGDQSGRAAEHRRLEDGQRAVRPDRPRRRLRRQNRRRSFACGT